MKEKVMEKKIKKEIKEEIKKDMLIGDVIQKYPETAFVMMQEGMHCVGCHANRHETIEQGAKAHGLSDEQIDKMISLMNKQIQDLEKNKDHERTTEKTK